MLELDNDLRCCCNELLDDNNNIDDDDDDDCVANRLCKIDLQYR